MIIFEAGMEVEDCKRCLHYDVCYQRILGKVSFRIGPIGECDWYCNKARFPSYHKRVHSNWLASDGHFICESCGETSSYPFAFCRCQAQMDNANTLIKEKKGL